LTAKTKRYVAAAEWFQLCVLIVPACQIARAALRVLAEQRVPALAGRLNLTDAVLDQAMLAKWVFVRGFRCRSRLTSRRVAVVAAQAAVSV
jgi:hypothetical protein